MSSQGLSHLTIEMVEGICSDVVEIVEPAKQGYQLTLRLDFAKIPNSKGLIFIFIFFKKEGQSVYFLFGFFYNALDLI